MAKTRRETIVGYKAAKEAMENGYQVICYHTFRGGSEVHLYDPGANEICEKLRIDTWAKLRKECHLDRSENRRSNRSRDHFWKLGLPEIKVGLAPMPGADRLAELKQETEDPKLMLYTFGCNTYSGKLVAIQIPATTQSYAAQIARKMAEAARELIDIDEGVWLNNEEVYE